MSYDPVLPAFRGLSEACEGRVRWPYLDILGKVTVGIGCLIDSVEAAAKLPWKTASGKPATRLEIVNGWNRVKAEVRLAKIGAKFAEGVSGLWLTDADVNALFASRAAAFEAELRKFFPAWDLFPADAQLGILSMAWALGPDFAHGYPRFTAVANAQDWATALDECTIGGEEKNAGLKPRNAANRVCFGNAAAVRFDFVHAPRSRGTHPYSVSDLYWPKALPVTS